MTYKFLISGIEAGNVSVNQNTYCAGIPSPTMFIGLVETIRHELGYERLGAKVSPIFHNISVDYGKTRPEMIYNKNQYLNDDIPEDMTAFIKFSLIVDMPEDVNTNDITKTVNKLKIGGSPIFGDIKTEQIGDNKSGYDKSKRGYVLMPFFNEVNKGIYSFGEDDSFKKVFKTLSTTIIKDGEGKIVGYESNNVGFRVPVSIGYRFLKNVNLKNPRYLRDKEKPHKFAEPGVGIAEFVSVRNSMLGTFNDDETMFYWVCDENKTVINKTYL